MQFLKKFSALLFVALILVAGACGQDETMDEIESNVEINYDPNEGNEGGDGGGGMGSGS